MSQVILKRCPCREWHQIRESETTTGCLCFSVFSLQTWRGVSILQDSGNAFFKSWKCLWGGKNQSVQGCGKWHGGNDGRFFFFPFRHKPLVYSRAFSSDCTSSELKTFDPPTKCNYYSSFLHHEVYTMKLVHQHSIRRWWVSQWWLSTFSVNPSFLPQSLCALTKGGIQNLKGKLCKDSG